MRHCLSKHTKLSEICRNHRDDYEDYALLRCEAIPSLTKMPSFLTNSCLRLHAEEY